jgi:hypothetical protein
VASVLATGPKDCGFEPSQADGFFKGDKNPQHTFLSDGKYNRKVAKFYGM